MTHSVVDSVRSLKARSRLFAVLNLAILPLVVACAGDLDPGLGKGGGSGTATGGTTGTGGGTGTGGAGATGTGGSGAGGAGAVCDAFTKILSVKCAPMCHMPSGQWSFLDLSTEAMAAAAVGKAQVFPCAADTASKVVNPSAPLTGTLFSFVSGSTCGAGTQMPLGGAPLTADEIACIKSYYTAKLK